MGVERGGSTTKSGDVAQFLRQFHSFSLTTEGQEWRARWRMAGAPVATAGNRWRIRSRAQDGRSWISVFDDAAKLLSTLPEDDDG